MPRRRQVRKWAAQLGVAIGARGRPGGALELVINGSAVSAPNSALPSAVNDSVPPYWVRLKLRGARDRDGRGYGHGVGMSQVGAHKLAQEGRSAAEIIKYYYKNVQIEDWWA